MVLLSRLLKQWKYTIRTAGSSSLLWSGLNILTFHSICSCIKGKQLTKLVPVRNTNVCLTIWECGHALPWLVAAAAGSWLRVGSDAGTGSCPWPGKAGSLSDSQQDRFLPTGGISATPLKETPDLWDTCEDSHSRTPCQDTGLMIHVHVPYWRSALKLQCILHTRGAHSYVFVFSIQEECYKVNLQNIAGLQSEWTLKIYPAHTYTCRLRALARYLYLPNTGTHISQI